MRLDLNRVTRIATDDRQDCIPESKYDPAGIEPKPLNRNEAQNI